MGAFAFGKHYAKTCPDMLGTEHDTRGCTCPVPGYPVVGCAQRVERTQCFDLNPNGQGGD